MKGERSRIRSIRGPVVLITVGALFALQNFTPYDFGQTWPVILLVLGLLILIERTGAPAPEPPPPPPQYAWQPPPWQPPAWQQPPAGQPAPGGYRATNYAQAPDPQQPTGTDAASSTGPAKGGFGTSAPPKPDVPTDNSTPGGTV
jgi:hypothetical protein